MAWILDTGVFGLLARVTRGQASWRTGDLHLAESAADECRRGNPLEPQTTLITTSTADGPVVTIVRLLSDDPGFVTLFDHLRKTARTITADFGEHEAIAICATSRPDLVFVTLDQAALALAVSELGSGRATTPYDLWDALREGGVVTPGVFDRLCTSTAARSQRLPVPWRFRKT